MANDPHWNSVVLAMHMDDTGLTDLKGHTVTLVGNAARSATQSKFGGYSAYLDGSGDWIALQNSADFDFTEPFCIEMFVRISAYGTTWATAISRYYDPTPAGWRIILPTNTTSVWLLYFTDSGGTIRDVSATDGTMALNTWYHIAVSWDGATYRVFHDGVMKNTLALDLPPKAVGTSMSPYIGTTNASSWLLTGYIDDLRITKGVARYTADFSVPTEAFPNTPPQLIGTVTDANSNPASRPVIAIPRNRASASYATISDATTGAFTLPAYDGSAHTVIALPVEGDPHWQNVVLALHMDGTNGSTTFADEKGKAVTATGGAKISTAQAKFGGASAVFDGNNDFLTLRVSSDWAFGTGDFTIEFWLARIGDTVSGAGNGGVLLDFRTADPSTQLFLYVSGSAAASPRRVVLYVNSLDRIVSTAEISASFSHVTLVRSSGTTKMYINGVLQGTYTDTNNYVASPLVIGGRFAAVASDYRSFNGYIDDLRITKGVARYIHDFTPPSAAFPHAITGGTENALILDNITPV